jgi:hypothetical protein
MGGGAPRSPASEVTFVVDRLAASRARAMRPKSSTHQPTEKKEKRPGNSMVTADLSLPRPLGILPSSSVRRRTYQPFLS